MKKFIIPGLLLLVVVFIFLGASGQVTLTLNAGTSVTKSSKAYAASQVDTVRMSRDRAVAAMSFAVHFKDSVSITSAIVRRVYDGVAEAALTTDSLAAFTGFVSTAAASVGATITMAPLPDEYWIVVTYAGSAQGFTTPTAVYEVNRQYNTSP